MVFWCVVIYSRILLSFPIFDSFHIVVSSHDSTFDGHLLSCQITLSVFLGTQFQDGASKALGLHLPFFISVVAAFPHTVEYMYEASLGMMLGAPLSIPACFYKCLAPVTLGNFVGGAAFTGAYFWYVYTHCEDGEKTEDWFQGLPGLDSSNGNRGRNEGDTE